MLKRLTRRQRAFLREFTALYRETQDALHYSRVAELLGINKVTAYLMLRILEKKGFVGADYVLPAEDGGRRSGRSRVVFFPTEAAFALIDGALVADPADDWESRRQQLMQELRPHHRSAHERLLAELLDRAGGQQVTLGLLAELILAVLLGLHLAYPDALDRLQAVGFPEHGEPCSVILGLAFADRMEAHIRDELLAHSSQCSAHWEQLDDDRRDRLRVFVRDAVAAIFAPLE